MWFGELLSHDVDYPIRGNVLCGCPLDETDELHDLYHRSGKKNNRKYLIPFEGEFVLKPLDLDKDQCERFAIAHLKRLKSRIQEKAEYIGEVRPTMLDGSHGR